MGIEETISQSKAAETTTTTTTATKKVLVPKNNVDHGKMTAEAAEGYTTTLTDKKDVLSTSLSTTFESIITTTSSTNYVKTAEKR
jgi:hypothetical protein